MKYSGVNGTKYPVLPTRHKGKSMNEQERQNHSYLGDGVYVEWCMQSQQFILRTGDHRDTHCDNKIYLEPAVYKALTQFVDRVFK